MANGNIVDAATYYKDSTTYTGAGGGVTNPWCIEDVFDFLNISSKGSGTQWYSEGNFILVNDINFNDHETYKFGFSTAYTINDRAWLNIDGRGHKISNLILYTTSVTFAANSISNIEFSNLIFISIAGDSSTFKFDSVTNCKFGLYLSNATTKPLLYRLKSCTDTTFNFYGTVYGTSECINIETADKCTYTRCLFNCNLTNPNVAPVIVNQNGYSKTVFLINCGFIGTINNYFNSTSNALTLFKSQGTPYFHITNSYYAVKTVIRLAMDHFGQHISVAPKSLTVNSRCFIDKSLITTDFPDAKVVFDDVPDLISMLTTEQAQSAEELANIGFLTV